MLIFERLGGVSGLDAKLAKLTTARSHHQAESKSCRIAFNLLVLSTIAFLWPAISQLSVIMGFSKYTTLALLALRAVSVFAADAVSQLASPVPACPDSKVSHLQISA